MHSGNLNTTALLIDGLVSLLESPPILAKLNTQEKQALQSLVISESSYPADAVIIDQGARIRSIHLVRSGWGCVYRDLSSGERQIIDFPMRCDFVGLRTADGYSYNTIKTITPMSVYEIPLTSLEKTIWQIPRLSMIFIELLSRQRSMLIEHLTNVGCRSAFVRTAHLLLELSDRVKSCGMGEPDSFYCPLTQYQLADALGLTPIHLNRMMRELREEGLVMFRSYKVEILDRQRLVEIAEYDGEFMRMSVFGKTK
ncbi:MULTISPECIES: Crp/Fnr family transcriptional regulator [Ochrobactrum]|uniref:Crp/Fnr family transcriptional regulator n=1 Tax=Ochrobactrum quorumnocens TaxID=271865 RepID=A0A5N1JRH4_9HYPH|nr:MULTISPECIES: Crp/Fnr family transcriptional regulator [Brucella/Ochrobactrum group]KAA9366777.1 Crp/Fnr family transcriptional regulator [[Ochrobactrum] quorumnocens]MBD7992320.1 Crp/Fnr family transcriptional regulator [Ochrobactrum gallinarum]MCV9906477.1 Crp/Fnr family transcriptional regulator [Brucella sp. HL-2]MDH7789930.1 CRP-like cAMP-binding protein [Ochrobactrum sp. AN78]